MISTSATDAKMKRTVRGARIAMVKNDSERTGA
jgi:hypothetical protein